MSATLSVELVGWTSFLVPKSLRDRYHLINEATGEPSTFVEGDGTDLAEFGGRATR